MGTHGGGGESMDQCARPGHLRPGLRRPSLKYQVAQDGLDSLISVSSDVDVDHLVDGLDHLHDEATARPLCLRVFLFALVLDVAFGSILLGTAAHVASTD
ncbi:hypothetical protein PVAP13_7KG246255 [Panicum virgatum]|uniref:Uncharacterized protein n=1 Tax=Panicum virgatum TaxID=38727 RepID=A0A8T0QNN4_PANVG|nr:hypothetical protein PVAP13_7KG246255 [Panicum virgatum]